MTAKMRINAWTPRTSPLREPIRGEDQRERGALRSNSTNGGQSNLQRESESRLFSSPPAAPFWCFVFLYDCRSLILLNTNISRLFHHFFVTNPLYLQTWVLTSIITGLDTIRTGGKTPSPSPPFFFLSVFSVFMFCISEKIKNIFLLSLQTYSVTCYSLSWWFDEE